MRAISFGCDLVRGERGVRGTLGAGTDEMSGLVRRSSGSTCILCWRWPLYFTPYSSTITSISFKCGEVVAARRKSFDLDPSSRTHHLAVTSHNSNPITRLGAAGPWNCPEATSEMQRMRGAVLGGAIPAHYERGSDPVSRRSRDVGNRNAKPSR
jgi:hypothetical protein